MGIRIDAGFVQWQIKETAVARKGDRIPTACWGVGRWGGGGGRGLTNRMKIEVGCEKIRKIDGTRTANDRATSPALPEALSCSNPILIVHQQAK